MKIGILAWGSLIPEKGVLEIVDDKWCNDGPFLPIEFARISGTKNLTLVICPAFDEVQTYYAVSKKESLQDAIENLAARERCLRNLSNIGYINFKTGEIQSKKLKSELSKLFSQWNINKNLDALIWSDFDENFKDKMKCEFSMKVSIQYLESLTKDELAEAKKYILQTPPQTQTRHRKALEAFLSIK